MNTDFVSKTTDPYTRGEWMGRDLLYSSILMLARAEHRRQNVGVHNELYTAFT